MRNLQKYCSGNILEKDFGHVPERCERKKTCCVSELSENIEKQERYFREVVVVLVLIFMPP